jgi:hypothetical protein
MDEDEREIWEVTHVSEEEVDTTEGEGVDFLLNSWSWTDGHRLTTRRRRRTCLDYCLDYGLCFLINIVETRDQHEQAQAGKKEGEGKKMDMSLSNC